MARFKPPTKMTVSQWADERRRLSPEASAEPGRWVTSRAEYQRGIMDACSDATIARVVFIKSAQVGATEIMLNVLGYHIDQDPAPVLVLQPTLEMGKAFSKDRLAPMLRDTPALGGKVKDARSRDADNTVLHKVFPGGHVTIAGANSAASLASRPIRVLIGDEVDRYPPSAGTEGDPVRLARKRTANFWNRREVLGSTPTIKDFSRIEDEWELSDQRRFFVPCSHCGHEQHLQWKNVRWPEGRPDLAAIHCEECGTEWTEGQRLKAIRRGKWVATKPDNPGRVAGFHLNELYSPWSTPAKMAVEFMECKGDPEKLKTFVNTSLGETFEESAERASGVGLMKRREGMGERGPGGYDAPPSVLIVTCGVDVQDDRLEVERVGWAIGEETWSLDHRVFYGDPSTKELWDELDVYLLEPTRKTDGDVLRVAATAVDSGGHYTQMTYAFARGKHVRKVHAIKGVAGAGRAVWPKKGKRTAKSRDVNVFMVGVDSAKDVVYARLKVMKPGPGFNHFPDDRDQAYFDQLTSEVVKRKRTRGYPVRVYELPPGKRNEALDLRVYAYAAFLSLNAKWRFSQVPRPAPTPQLPLSDEVPEGAPAARESAQPAAAPQPDPTDSPRKPRRLRRGSGGWLRR